MDQAMKECRFCGAEIRREALKCRYCMEFQSDDHSPPLFSTSGWKWWTLSLLLTPAFGEWCIRKNLQTIRAHLPGDDPVLVARLKSSKYWLAALILAFAFLFLIVVDDCLLLAAVVTMVWYVFEYRPQRAKIREYEHGFSRRSFRWRPLFAGIAAVVLMLIVSGVLYEPKLDATDVESIGESLNGITWKLDKASREGMEFAIALSILNEEASLGSNMDERLAVFQRFHGCSAAEIVAELKKEHPGQFRRVENELKNLKIVQQNGLL